MKYVCELCGYIYDEQAGEPRRKIAPGTAYADLPESFECPVCGYGKEAFDQMVPKRSEEVLRVQTKARR